MNKVNFYCGKVNSQGGSKISMLNIIYLLNSNHKKIQVFVSEKGWFTRQLDYRNIDYIIISEPQLVKKITKQTNFILSFIYLLLSTPQLIMNWIQVNKYIKRKETVILNEPRDLMIFFPMLFKRKIKLIGWIRGENINFISRQILRRVDELVAVSEIVQQKAQVKINKPITRIYNFMNDRPITIKKKKVNKPINLAVIGSIQKIKGQLDALKVIEKFKKEELKLYIIGREFDRNYTEELRAYIEDKKITNYVTFLGHIDNIPDFINENIHITLIPSQTESFCRVAMESLSVGVPVVAYNVGGLKEVIIDKETGFLVEKDNVEELYFSVKYLIENIDMYQKMSDRGVIDWNDRFSSASIKQQLYQVLK